MIYCFLRAPLNVVIFVLRSPQVSLFCCLLYLIFWCTFNAPMNKNMIITQVRPTGLPYTIFRKNIMSPYPHKVAISELFHFATRRSIHRDFHAWWKVTMVLLPRYTTPPPLLKPPATACTRESSRNLLGILACKEVVFFRFGSLCPLCRVITCPAAG